MPSDKIKQYSKEIFNKLIYIRREIHKYPELGFQEFKTSDTIKRFLEELGLNVINLAGTGLVTTLYGKGSGRTIALRADIDALPIKEENTFDY
ncbi:MAG: amidohydrolase, partial [Bacillota bacterium]|nr:amidohydrolase [Bacillota bacterium]